MGFAELLKSSDVILLDGAMGTELEKRGHPGGPLNNLSNPAAVSEIHRDYAAAGSIALITNTLTMNRVYVDSHHVEVDVEKVNQAGARLAREALKGKGYVLGNLSSTGQMLEPLGPFLEEEFIAAFKEQASFLAVGGVDGFIIETMIDLREAVCALKGCREASALPVIVSISYYTKTGGGKTAMGNSVEECARVLTSEGADAIGANCGSLDPEQMAEIVSATAAVTKLPIVVEPNAGKPRLVSGATVYDMSPADFAAGMSTCRKAGARILGGCCGTSPEHVKAMTRMLGGP